MTDSLADTEPEVDTAQEPPAVPLFRRVIRRTSTVVVPAALVVAAVVLLRHEKWIALHPLLRVRAAPLLVLAGVANLVGMFAALVSWRALLVALAGPVPFGVSARIYFVGLVSKVVPGSVWGVLIHMRLGAAAGVSATRMAAIYVAGIPIGLSTGMALGVLAAPALFGGPVVVAAVAVGAAVAACLVRPDLIGLVGRLAARVLRRSAPTPLPGTVIRRSILASLASWTISGLHLWLIVILLGGSPWRSLPLCVGGFALAVTVGGLVFFLPDGLGPREVMLTTTLAAVLPWQAALAAAVASRVVLGITEILATGAALIAAWRDERGTGHAG